MVGGLIAANSSTILTHLNWGASYLVHDFYRRFIKKDASEKHYVAAGRVVTIILFFASSALVFVLDTAKDAFDIILQVGAGTGLLYLVRWFWWRVNAWCEVVGDGQFVRRVAGPPDPGEERSPHGHARRAARHHRRHDRLLGGHGVRRARDRPRDADRVLHEGPAVRPRVGTHPPRGGRRAGTSCARSATTSRSRSSAGCSGCTVIWSSLFTVGNFLYGRTTAGPRPARRLRRVGPRAAVRGPAQLWCERAGRG